MLVHRLELIVVGALGRRARSQGVAHDRRVTIPCRIISAIPVLIDGVRGRAPQQRQGSEEERDTSSRKVADVGRIL